MKSPQFYARFRQYDYMLVYQLDAYVFRDELQYWCRRGFSYIGGPWLNYDNLRSWKYQIMPFVKRLLANVGGGGFSLRKVEQHYRLARRYRCMGTLYNMMEDQFWCSVVARLEHTYRVPDISTALEFCFDKDPEKAYEMADKRLPFGCHAWSSQRNYDTFWRAHIPEKVVSNGTDQ